MQLREELASIAGKCGAIEPAIVPLFAVLFQVSASLLGNVILIAHCTLSICILHNA